MIFHAVLNELKPISGSSLTNIIGLLMQMSHASNRSAGARERHQNRKTWITALSAILPRYSRSQTLCEDDRRKSSV